MFLLPLALLIPAPGGINGTEAIDEVIVDGGDVNAVDDHVQVQCGDAVFAGITDEYRDQREPNDPAFSPQPLPLQWQHALNCVHLSRSRSPLYSSVGPTAPDRVYFDYFSSLLVHLLESCVYICARLVLAVLLVPVLFVIFIPKCLLLLIFSRALSRALTLSRSSAIFSSRPHQNATLTRPVCLFSTCALTFAFSYVYCLRKTRYIVSESNSIRLRCQSILVAEYGSLIDPTNV